MSTLFNENGDLYVVHQFEKLGLEEAQRLLEQLQNDVSKVQDFVNRKLQEQGSTPADVPADQGQPAPQPPVDPATGQPIDATPVDNPTQPDGSQPPVDTPATPPADPNAAPAPDPNQPAPVDPNAQPPLQ